MFHKSNLEEISCEFEPLIAKNTEKHFCKLSINPIELDKLEMNGLSEQQIAERLGCSRMGLYKYRKRIGCPQKIRQGKGTSKYSQSEKKTLKNIHQKNYRLRTILRYGDAERGRDRIEQKRIVFAVLGRRLKPNECMHHIDNNPANNTHNNLVICTRDYHRNIFHTAEAQAKIKNYCY